MEISVVICTFNRGASLKRTLNSIMGLSIPNALEWELIVVDNNSSDTTRETVEKYQKLSGVSIRYVKEEQQGLSYARNRGVRESGGKLIAFTDDDVLVDQDWMRNIVEAFEQYDVACVGGKILPAWEKPKPTWLSEPLYKYLALADYGETPCFMDRPIIWGANFAIRADVFKTYGLFNTRMGRVPGKLYGGEETDLLKRLLKGNEKILYLPTAIVRHIIPKERMQKSYFRKWVFDHGELAGILLGRYSSRNILGIPYYAIRQLITAGLSYLYIAPTAGEKHFEHQLMILDLLGFLKGRIKYKLTS